MYCCKSKIEKKVTFILAAAGSGKRMNLSFPKQFLEYQGEPLFYSSLKIAYKSSFIDDIIIVTNKDNVAYIQDFCKHKKIENVKVIEGGKERQNSIYNALSSITDTDFVIIQDGVRPFLKEDYLKNTLESLDAGYDGAIIGVKVKDTVKIIDENNEIVETPKRDFIILAHTPQAFKYKTLKEAHEEALQKNIIATDDAMLIEKFNKKVKFIEGNYDNIKITTQEDLKFLK